MITSATGEHPASVDDIGPGGKTVQQYIDETPRWEDGTIVAMTPMTRMQWLIWGLAAAGKFFEGMVVFMTGVALPLLSNQWSLGEFEHGMVAAASLFGILIGATMLGGLSDHYGRKRMFIVEMILFTFFLVMTCLAMNFAWFVIALLGLGIALGCDYPTAHVVISESIPSRARGRLVLSAFGFQAVGALFGTAVGYLILSNHPELDAWRWMYAAAIIPAVVVVIGRFYITESVHWLFAKGRVEEAQAEAARLLKREPAYPTKIKLKKKKVPKEGVTVRKPETHYGVLFKKKNRRATILASVPWFLQDLGTYGIGIFTPTILAAAVGQKTEHVRSVADIVHNDMLAARGAAVIDILLIIGIIVAVLLADRVGRIKLQIIGFIGCALGLFIAALSTYVSGSGSILLIFIGFMLFNFMTNMGPNAQTYLLAGEVFPTQVRGKGAGFAASFAKIGAVLTAFLFPVLLADIGTQALLYGLVVTSLIGAWVTWQFRIETTGKNLEDLDAELDADYAHSPV
ncbi:MFS transporter [Amorphus orientalis]|uniref:MFS family permease n=1 Tax=Amorphus orientalis TaxID=649198 RepID=A0AAE3VRR2_9HYPH|nr:MFS transporter [Amorphus orientalis]MDQ0317149.1 MFS family permease [Amorphus orientalis]